LSAESDAITRFFAGLHQLSNNDLDALLHIIIVADRAGAPLTSGELRKCLGVTAAAVTYLVEVRGGPFPIWYWSPNYWSSPGDRVLSGPRVGPGPYLAQRMHGHQRVDLSGGHRCVAEQLLHHPDVGAAVEQVRRERVPQGVR
jgi:hypothetical protein